MSDVAIANLTRLPSEWNKCYIGAMSSIPPIQRHIRDLTHAELVKLAEAIGGKTSKDTLRQYALGRRQMSSAMAIKVEKAGKKINMFLPREAHAAGCSVCEFARACRKAQAK